VQKSLNVNEYLAKAKWPTRGEVVKTMLTRASRLVEWSALKGALQLLSNRPK